MGKKLLFGFVFATVGIFASFAVSQAQFGGSTAQPARPDIENDVRNLYLHLQWEKRGENPNAELLEKHAELDAAVTKYIATDRISKSIAELEMIVKERPGSDEAKRAATAITALKGEALRPTPDQGELVKPRRKVPADLEER